VVSDAAAEASTEGNTLLCASGQHKQMQPIVSNFWLHSTHQEWCNVTPACSADMLLLMMHHGIHALARCNEKLH
jgi:hypothetical protein